MKTRLEMTGHPVLDAVLAVKKAFEFSDQKDEHRGQQLSLQRIWELLSGLSLGMTALM
jgi:hypothetical protein